MMMKKRLVALCAVALAFLLAMNLLPALADTLERIPLAGGLFLVLDWRTYALIFWGN